MFISTNDIQSPQWGLYIIVFTDSADLQEIKDISNCELLNKTLKDLEEVTKRSSAYMVF